MKKAAPLAIIFTTIILIVNFDAIVIFLLSGFIPGINIVLAPSTMIAVFIASTIMIFALRKRHAVYQRCLTRYDDAVDQMSGIFGKKNDSPGPNSKTKRPRRHYQKL